MKNEASKFQLPLFS